MGNQEVEVPICLVCGDIGTEVTSSTQFVNGAWQSIPHKKKMLCQHCQDIYDDYVLVSYTVVRKALLELAQSLRMIEEEL